MRSVVVRTRVIRISVWVVLALVLIAWAVSVAIEAPWTPWFTIALWASIGIGFVVRALMRKTGKRASLDPFHDLNQIYQGRTQAPSVEGSSVESAEVGHPFPGTRTPPPAE